MFESNGGLIKLKKSDSITEDDLESSESTAEARKDTKSTAETATILVSGVSPLMSVKEWLMALRFVGGFPLVAANEELTKFRLSRMGSIHVTLLYIGVVTLLGTVSIKVMVITVINIIIYLGVQQIVQYSYGVTAEAMVKAFQRQGMSTTDIYSFFFGNHLVIIAIAG